MDDFADQLKAAYAEGVTNGLANQRNGIYLKDDVDGDLLRAYLTGWRNGRSSAEAEGEGEEEQAA